jgi:hypothetical protein
MLRTYTFYLRDGGDPVRFKPFLCPSDIDALRRARALLMDHPECESIEVMFGDQHVFTVEQARP